MGELFGERPTVYSPERSPFRQSADIPGAGEPS